MSGSSDTSSLQWPLAAESSPRNWPNATRSLTCTFGHRGCYCQVGVRSMCVLVFFFIEVAGVIMKY